MKVIVAKSAGFCFGVRRAVTICESAIAENRCCVTLGPIIHNEHAVRELEAKGLHAVSNISEVEPHNTVIIRSHGACKSESEALAALGVEVIDATCPYVKKIHDIVREERRAGRLPVIIGEHSHPETVAISSWCDDCEVFETAEELSHWIESAENAAKPVSVVFQTTNTEVIYETCIEIVKKVCTNYKIFDTICVATYERQQEAVKLSKTADIMIVIGGRNSANSLRLADICREHCPRVFFAESAKDLDNADIRVSDIVGVTAGASTPAWIIKEVTHKMSEEVKFDETTVRQESLEQVSPETPEDETENETPAAVLTECEVPDPDLAGGSKESKDSKESGTEDAECAACALDSAEQSLTDADEISVEPEAACEVAEAEVPAPVEEADAPGAPDTAAEAEPPGADEDAACEADAAVEIPETPDAEPVAEAESPQEPAEVEQPLDAAEESASAEAAAASESFEEMLEKSIKTLHTGQKVSGVVTSITSTEVSVDLGTKQSGYIPISEFTDDANTRIEDIIKIGDTIESFVMRVNDVEGMVMLSKKRLDAIKNWDIIEAAKENRSIVEGFVTEENKGGVVVNVKGVRVFVPASQTGLPKSAPMSELVRKPVKLRITEVNQSRRRVVGSIRAVQADERREKSDRVWNNIEKGKQYSGIVKSMTSYGVFVDIGGVDGMIHISELSWTRIKQPSEVMAVGDEVTVYVLSFDKESRKISLGYKKSEDNPWTKFTSQRSVGDIVNVKIVKMMPFGAFAEICAGVDGLIHISQITDHRIGLPSEVLSDGQVVDVKITEIDYDRKKVSLSIRALLDPSSQPLSEKEMDEAANADNEDVIVYDTDAPPEIPDSSDVDDDEKTEETE